jgi:quercetin dioxygenase-like cupin family protein/uncharacterized protein YndB with AHSA1/START domain
MAAAGEVLEIPQLGMSVEFRRTTAQTGGEVLEVDVIGRPQGFIAQAHVHPNQSERLEVISGTMALRMNGGRRVLQAGESVDTPPGTPHRHVAAGDGPGRVRITLRPAGRTEAWLEQLARMSRDGGLTRKGFPRPVAGARLIKDYAGEGHAAFPSARMQQRLAGAILAGASLRSREYRFVDEWDVAAPPEAVFAALADAESYPRWWKPVYRVAHAIGPAGVGQVSRQRFKGRLPYTLATTTRTVRYERPHVLEAEVEGDLRGRGRWTLTPTAAGTHVRFDWEVSADRALLRHLSPLLRPAFRWNHAWAIARAVDGLEPYAQQLAARAPAVESLRAV